MNEITPRTPTPDVRVRVGELILHGFAPGDRQRIGAALERELARLFAERGVPAGLGQAAEFDRIDAGSFDLPPGGTAAGVGRRLAMTLYRGLSR